MTTSVATYFQRQDGLITRAQALESLADDEVRRRLGREWQVVLPGVYAESLASLTDRQRLRAGLLHAGPRAMLSDTSALRLHNVPFVPEDSFVRLLVPADVQRLTREFVVLRRTVHPPEAQSVAGFPTAPVARAACEFGLRHRNPRDVLAVMAAIVQEGRTTLRELQAEIEAGPSRGRPALLRAMEPLRAGIRSVAEADFRSLVRRSTVLPEPLWNSTIRLPNGVHLVPDALFVDARLIHETNGRRFHAPGEAGEDRFESMQRRHDVLSTAGFTVLHNSPRRIAREPDAVRMELEACYRRQRGRGLPAGCEIVATSPTALHSAM